MAMRADLVRQTSKTGGCRFESCRPCRSTVAQRYVGPDFGPKPANTRAPRRSRERTLARPRADAGSVGCRGSIVRVAGIEELGGDVRLLEVPDARVPRTGEVLIEVRAAGVGNWDDFARTGRWDLGPIAADGARGRGRRRGCGRGRWG